MRMSRHRHIIGCEDVTAEIYFVAMEIQGQSIGNKGNAGLQVAPSSHGGTTHLMTSLISESVGSMAWRNCQTEAAEWNNALRSSSTMLPLQLHRANAQMQHDDLPFREPNQTDQVGEW